MNISLISELSRNEHQILLFHEKSGDLLRHCSEQQLDYAAKMFEQKAKWVKIQLFPHSLFLVKVDTHNKDFSEKERLRIIASEISAEINKENAASVVIEAGGVEKDFVMAIVEGLALSNYRYEALKSKPSKSVLINQIFVHNKDIKQEELTELKHLIDAVFITRNLVNEPFSHQNSLQLSKQLQSLGHSAGFDVEVLNKNQIVELRMGGLLGVNKGSNFPPTFCILEYLPEEPINPQPYVLVGKGVVFDTGGVNVKHPYDFMMTMKCDMAGAATVGGVIYAIAKNKLPIHVVGLIPITDNFMDSRSIVPGDVLTMFNGKTVEVLNTDAEGRLILGDALAYASRYKPTLVIDVATLTGSAANAIGKFGIVYMGKVPIKIKNDVENSGREVYERVVEFPLWEEYDEWLQSDVADLKNIGLNGGAAGAIVAGRFLQHFTDYDWLHFDIAGCAFYNAKDAYRGKNGTGYGVRLLYHFLKSQIMEEE